MWGIDICYNMWYNIVRNKYRKENQIVSWEVINTNPQYKIFRLYELRNEQDEYTYLTEAELEIKEQFEKDGYIKISGVV